MATSAPELEEIERYRPELNGYCYRMLGSPFDAEDAVQETVVRAWQNIGTFEGRSAFRSWLYRIATNVCLDMLRASQRRARPVDLGPAQEPLESNLRTQPETTWIEPAPDPADAAIERDSVRLAFVAALQHLPARQRAVLILCEVLRWQAAEVAELLDTSVASVNSALQRARATLSETSMRQPAAPVDRALLERYVAAFEAYDIDALTKVIHEDAVQSMPPFDMWLAGREDIFSWWFGPGIACKGSRVIPVGTANGAPAFGQYKVQPDGSYAPWALQVIEFDGDRAGELTFFLSTERLFPLFGLPDRLPPGSSPSRP
jgi:RNA polymerase sigma-70 factor (ECF subfamily)